MQPLLKSVVIVLDPLKKYNIPFVGLSLGNHSYQFDIDDSFFDCFEKTEVMEASIKFELLMEKTGSMLVLDFNIWGKVKLVCDRCSDIYWQDINSTDRLYIKFGDSHYEQTEQIIVISQNETHFDVSQYAYEFIHLNLPARRMHPGGTRKADNCDPEVLRKLDELKVTTDTQGKPITGVKDQWEALRTLKKN